MRSDAASPVLKSSVAMALDLRAMYCFFSKQTLSLIVRKTLKRVDEKPYVCVDSALGFFLWKLSQEDYFKVFLNRNRLLCLKPCCVWPLNVTAVVEGKRVAASVVRST